MWQSSNPVLTSNEVAQQYYGSSAEAMTRPDVCTLAGVANKTGILVSIAVAGGVFGYWLLATLQMTSVVWISAIASFGICLGFGFFVARKPKAAAYLGPIYAIVEGIFLGAFTALADAIVQQQGLQVMGGVGLQAFIVTIACVISMLVLYRTGIVRPTPGFRAIITVAAGGIMLAYIISFVMGMLFGKPLPLISFASAVNDTGVMGFLGLGINIFILIIASLFLVIDFGEIDEGVTNGAPKYMEWFYGFGLLVTLAWIYFEAVKLVVRIAVLFGGED